MRPLFFLISLWIIGFLTLPAKAQEAEAPAQASETVTPQPPPQPVYGNMADYLPRLNYDPAQSGPLIVVAPDSNYKLERPLPAKDKPAPALATLGGAFGRKIVTVHRLTVLAPREMTQINPEPGKARLLENLQSNELFQWLFASFTPQQWAKACSEGITIADVTSEQRPYFDQILPKRLRIQKRILEKSENDGPGSYTIREAGEPVTVDRNQLKIRFTRGTTLMFRSADSENSYYGAGGGYDQQEAGQANWARIWDGGEYEEQDRSSIFGVPILAKSANRLKLSELYYAAPR